MPKGQPPGELTLGASVFLEELSQHAADQETPEIFTDLAAISCLLENLSDQASRLHASSCSSSTIHMMPLI